jgi:hypothetical protein
VLTYWPLPALLLLACAVSCIVHAEPLRAVFFCVLGAAVVVLAEPAWRSRWRKLRRSFFSRRRTAAHPLNPAFPSLECMHAKPPIYACSAFLDGTACEALIAVAKPHLVASTAGGNTSSAGRTSKSCMLARSRAEAQALLARCAELTGQPVEHLEDPQVARYRPGEFYEPHLDAPDAKRDADGAGFVACGGTRIATVLVYLNDVASGGETAFTRLHSPASSPASPLVVRPQRGKALLFFPASASGRVDVRLEHEARPPCDGAVKWVAQVWVRQRPDPTHTFIANPDSV